MKMPKVLLDMNSEEFDAMNAYNSYVETRRDLERALWHTRREFGGMPIADVATTIKKAYEPEEVDSLIKELST